MFCGYCGNKLNSSEHRFCTSCGKPLKDQESSVLDNQDLEDEYLASPDSAPPELESVEENLSSYELPPTEVLSDISESTYSDVETENQPINSAFEELDKIQTGLPIEQYIPESKYLCVYWTNDKEFPWKALTLDKKFMLGHYSLEEEAANATAEYHKIARGSLKLTSKWKGKREEFRHSLIGKIYGPESDEFKEVASEIAKPRSEEDWSPDIIPTSSYKEDVPPNNTPSTQLNISEKIIEAVEGKKYYVDQFIPFYETGKGIKSWNWAAFLVGPIWYLYRKVFSLFFIALFFYSIDFWARQDNAPELVQVITSLSFLASWIYCTVNSNKTHYYNVLRKIKGRRKSD